MDFYDIRERSIKSGVTEIYPDFKVCKSKDLMVRGGKFYAIWDDEAGLWSTDEYDVARLVDEELKEYKKTAEKKLDGIVKVKFLSNYSSKSWLEFRNYINRVADSSHQLDSDLTFSNTEVKKKDYVSKRLSYPLQEGNYEAWDKMVGTLYDPIERAKIEWSIGAIVAGDAKHIQKFLVLYGEAGAGKSTILNIIQKLFDGYYTTFEAKALTSSSNAFATEVFKANPLVAIQHDGDLSKIEDNSKFNSIVSHEEMTMNEKYKSSYTAKINCFLFMATNRPVKITDAKSGIIRRLIDVKPSGNKIPSREYHSLISKIDFELGAIAFRCLEVYREMGKNYYAGYKPLEMIFQTDVFYNFIEYYYDDFKNPEGISLKRAYTLYKTYCEECGLEYRTPMYKFREELKNYFKHFVEHGRLDGALVRSYYTGFITTKFQSVSKKDETPNMLVLDSTESIFDKECASCLAQYANVNEIPNKKWIEVHSTLSNINTKQLHYVKVPENHIVIDFDLKDENGNKSLEKNLEAASKWPPTYAEFSKSQAGIHLHYIYDGDVSMLSRVYSEGIEVKVYTGNSSLRRKLSKCNTTSINHISSGLPMKEEKPMINFESVRSEKGLRELIKKNLHKEIHPGTKPSVDFIHTILEETYNAGVKYDVTDMRPAILAFASNSTNQADYCIKLVNKMQFKSEEPSIGDAYKKDTLLFFDVEVFPNLFVVAWKIKGQPVVKMINPSSEDIETLLNSKLIGFNCRRYDNHIMYARYIGYNNEQLYTLSQRIISGSANAMFGEAYNLSYTDVYDFASAGNKKSLKKFEIELGIHHQELGLPWDKPVPKELWPKVADYCGNDVEATEVVFDYLAGDWTARQILAELSGLTVNDTTNAHSTRIVFGNNKKPQGEFIYTDLSVMFPGYVFENGKSTYRGEEVGEGGNVYAEPGMHVNVGLLDVESMHPTSTEELNLFGEEYTKRFSELKKARLSIKHKDFDTAKKMLDGKLAKFLDNSKFTPKDLSNGLKTVINSVYGLTAAKFDNAFKDPRNIDNIVAKRGALFMIDLKHAVQEKGFTVAHVKTDSIKIPNVTPEIIDFVMEFGKKYGYNFEHEATYEKMCLVNDAVYVAKYGWAEDKNLIGQWTATGTQFIQPYVFKTLFSQELITLSDLCETKSVTTALYLDMNESLPDVSMFEKEKDSIWKKLLSKDELPNDEVDRMEKRLQVLDELIPEGHDYHFVGKVGAFCPIKPGKGGGLLLRLKEENKYSAATGSKGFRWLESELVKELNKEDDIDMRYYNRLVDDAIDNISQYGDFEWFISNESIPLVTPPCGKRNTILCDTCPSRDGSLCKLDSEFKPILKGA